MRKRTSWACATCGALYFIIFSAVFSGCGVSTEEPGNNEIALQVHALINQHRVDQGLDTLCWNDVIADQCYEHSQDMANAVVPFGHDGFTERVDNIAQELEISISAAGENVAYNMGMDDPAQVAVTAWLNSPGHRANIEGDYYLTGVGVACPDDDSLTFYFTQLFIKD